MSNAEGKIIMAVGTRTAPTVDGTGQFIRVSVLFVSLTEDRPRSQSYLFSASATDAQIEAFIAALQDMTTASIAQIEVGKVYAGAPSKANATGDGRTSLEDYIVISTKNVVVNNTRRLYIPAPHNTNFEPETELLITDTSVGNNVELGALLTAFDAVKANYDPVTISFTEHQDSNVKQLL